MTTTVAINGFGRIGRLFLRLALANKNINVVAINDLSPSNNLAYLFKYDSTHGTYDGTVSSFEDTISINGKQIVVFSELEPEKLPWGKLKVDYVIEATGHFTKYELAKKHLTAGAKRVIVTAPGKDIPVFVMGVNHKNYNPRKDFIISNASCTTNCLAPITKVLLDNFGIEEGLMTTIHAMTASQPCVDGTSKKDWRGGRGASQNLIPSATGAAVAVAQCLPEIKGKLTGMAIRVPVADVSIVDLTVKLSTSTTYEEISLAMKKASEGKMKGLLGYCDEQLVSSDFIGSTYSGVFDKQAGIALNDKFYKIIAWYDNEMGYSARLVDLIKLMASKEISA